MAADIIMSIILIIISIIWIIEGLRLGLWIPGVSADSGFVPTVFAVLTLCASVFLIYTTVKKSKAEGKTESKKEEIQLKKKLDLSECGAAIPVVFCIGAIFCLQLFGLVITVFAVGFLWMRVVSKICWKRSLMYACFITLFIYLIFELWLKIPFPGDIIRL